MALVEKLLWQIEAKLHDEVRLEELASLCAVSVYHMARVFRQTTGLSPMAYLRARRLTEAARSLAMGKTDIMDVALEAQYCSHEAFTRAFVNYFGIAPNQVRAQKTFEKLDIMETFPVKKELIIELEAPRQETLGAMKLVGTSCYCTFENTVEIPRIWKIFNERMHEIEFAKPGAAYGACCDVKENGQFRYLAGVPVREEQTIPVGMDMVEIPPSTYAVFQHNGHISDFHKTVYTAWNKSLPDLGWQPRKSPDFERYDHRFDPETGRGIVELWIPIENQ